MSYIGNQPTQQAFLTDTFSGNASTTAFTMSVAPAGTTSMLVAVTGVVQDPSTYSVVGTTLTFTQAPPTGTNNISVRYLGIPASGVTTTAYRTVTEFTATAGQTTFTPPSYTVGYINVFRNGVRLGAADYTASNGTTVVLASGAATGDLVTTESFYVSSVLNAIPATAGAVNSTYITDAAVTPAKLSQPLTSGTAVASTSGTSIDFTSIPSWVKRVTVLLNGVSLSGTANLLIQAGSGSVQTTGYTSTWAYVASSATSGTATTGVYIQSGDPLYVINAKVELALLGSNIWIATGIHGNNTSTVYIGYISSRFSLSGALDRIRVTSTNGTDTFDAGSINILYE